MESKQKGGTDLHKVIDLILDLSQRLIEDPRMTAEEILMISQITRPELFSKGKLKDIDCGEYLLILTENRLHTRRLRGFSIKDYEKIILALGIRG